MSSSKRPSSAAPTVCPLDPSVVKFGEYLDRVYVSHMEESEAAYAAHVKASNELHEAEMAMMRSKRAVRALNTELDKATAAAAAATEIVDRKRKAADEAAAGFDSRAQITRGCYGTESKRRAPSSVYRPTSPMYHKVEPVYSAREEETQLPDVEHESQDPHGGDTTPSYVPQNPCGDGNSPVYRPLIGYSHINGEPIYSPTQPRYNPTSPRYSATSPKYSATSPTYTPTTPASPPPHPISPHVLAAAKRAGLKWGA